MRIRLDEMSEIALFVLLLLLSELIGRLPF